MLISNIYHVFSLIIYDDIADAFVFAKRKGRGRQNVRSDLMISYVYNVITIF